MKSKISRMLRLLNRISEESFLGIVHTTLPQIRAHIY